MVSNHSPPEDRFWDKVRKSDGCWEWTGSSRDGLYGSFDVDRRQVMAHRFSYELHVGKIPAGIMVCHHCDNTKCVRPDHLFLGTAKDNNRDCAAKGRKLSGDRHPLRINKEPRSPGEKNGRAILTEEKVREMRRRYDAEQATQSELVAEYGVSQSVVSKVVTRTSWKHIT
jgi:hypothetical protein